MNVCKATTTQLSHIHSKDLPRRDYPPGPTLPSSSPNTQYPIPYNVQVRYETVCMYYMMYIHTLIFVFVFVVNR